MSFISRTRPRARSIAPTPLTSPHLTWELTAYGVSDIPFLDLALSIDTGLVVYETYRKPQNKYLYLPRASTHHPSTFRGLVHGEVDRLINTNKTGITLEKHISFFVSKLVCRGYGKSEVQAVVREALRLAQLRRFKSKRSNNKVRSIYVKLPFSSSVNANAIRRSMRKHKHVVANLAKIGVSFGTQPNLFRLFYRHNWPAIWPRGS